MFCALVSILLLPALYFSKLRGFQFRPFSKIAFYIFVINFLALMKLGSAHVEDPFVVVGQISTALYFITFLIFILLGLIGNTLPYLNSIPNQKKNFS